MTEDYFDNQISNIDYQFNDMYGLTFIDQKNYEILIKAYQGLRNLNILTFDDLLKLKSMARHNYMNSFKIRELDSLQPRIIAQKFISKKEVRNFIISRDKNCLCCGSSKKLTLDHIVPISVGGLNEIDNLQTLCNSCNSKKSTQTIDYRKNGKTRKE